MRRSLAIGLSGLAIMGAVSSLAACGDDDPGVPPGEDAGPEAAPETDAAEPADAGPGDAASDARPDARDASTSTGFCNGLLPAPRFCDDFDDGVLGNAWDIATRAPASSVQDLDDVEFTSAPFSYYAAAKAAPAGGGANVSLRRTVLGTVNHPVLRFAMRPGTTTFAADGLIAIVSFDVASNHRFSLNLHTGAESPSTPGATLQETVGGTVVYHPLTGLPPANAWSQVTLDLDFVAGKANLSFGATRVLDNVDIQKVPGTETTLRLGVVYANGPTNDFEVDFDDVVIDF